MARIYQLETWLWLPRPRADVFAFFADAANLQRITPPFLAFRILTPPPIAMRAGARIDYRIGLRGLPLTWRTEITVWDPPHCFVDVQRRGPYRSWEHTHRFDEQDDGTLVSDRVRYSLPVPDLLAGVVNRLVVAPDLARIFTYRHDALRECFAAPGARVGPVRLGRSFSVQI